MFKNRKLREVLKRAFMFPFKLQSDYARENAVEVAALASAGYLTSFVGPREYSNKWRVTAIGIEKLRALGEL